MLLRFEVLYRTSVYMNSGNTYDVTWMVLHLAVEAVHSPIMETRVPGVLGEDRTLSPITTGIVVAMICWRNDCHRGALRYDAGTKSLSSSGRLGFQQAGVSVSQSFLDRP